MLVSLHIQLCDETRRTGARGAVRQSGELRVELLSGLAIRELEIAAVARSAVRGTGHSRGHRWSSNSRSRGVGRGGRGDSAGRAGCGSGRWLNSSDGRGGRRGDSRCGRGC